MTTFSEQFPIVFQALNVGFVQTLKLFFITLIGAIPLGLIISFGSMSAWRPFRVFRSVKWLSKFKPVRAITRLVIWVVRGTPLMLQLLVIYYFPGLVWKNNIWGSGEVDVLLPRAWHSCLTTPATSRKFTAAAFRASPGGSRRQVRCSA